LRLSYLIFALVHIRMIVVREDCYWGGGFGRLLRLASQAGGARVVIGLRLRGFAEGVCRRRAIVARIVDYRTHFVRDIASLF